MNFSRQELVRALADKGLVKMGPTGKWEPTREGRKLLAELDLLRQIVKERTRGS